MIQSNYELVSADLASNVADISSALTIVVLVVWGCQLLRELEVNLIPSREWNQ